MLGVTFQDVTNTDINWDTGHRDTIRHSVRSGIGYSQPFPSRQMLVVLSLEADSRSPHREMAGLEWRWRERLALRVGYDGRGGTAGLGLSLGPFRVDYALVAHELGENHRVGIAAGF
jgi:hypothetical protein